VLRTGEGGSNDDNDAEMTTTTTTVAVSIGNNMRSDAAAPLRQGSTGTATGRCHVNIGGGDVVALAVGCHNEIRRQKVQQQWSE
jgi:hypothetical protein